jgi:hypothetical protein
LRRAGGVDQQPEQALGLGPALHGVLLVHLARVLGEVPQPAGRLVASPDLLLGEGLEQNLDALAALIARPAAHDLHGVVERLRVAQVAHLGQRTQAQLGVAVAPQAGDQEQAAQLAGGIEVQHRLGAPPVVRGHARAGQHRPGLLLAPGEVLHGHPPQLALEDLRPAVLVRGHRHHPALDPQATPAAAAHGTDDNRPTAINVTVEERVQGDYGVVVGSGGVDEVHDDPGLLARRTPGHAAHALLIDALGGGGRQVHADGRAG